MQMSINGPEFPRTGWNGKPPPFQVGRAEHRRAGPARRESRSDLFRKLNRGGGEDESRPRALTLRRIGVRIRRDMISQRTVLLALADAQYGVFSGVARYARERQWHLAADMIYTARIPIGWRGDGIVSFSGYRRNMEKAFCSEVIRSINVEIVRARIVRVQELLTTTNRTACDPAASCGFSRPNQFFRSFRQRVGMSPGACRRPGRRNKQSSVNRL